MRNIPSHIHHFSWHSKISFELPIRFEEQDEDPDTNSAIYADDLDDDDELGAKVLAKATAVPENQNDAYRLLALESAKLPDRNTESFVECSVDGAPAVQQTLVYEQADIGIQVLRHETFAQIGNIVFSLTCLAPAARAEEYIPAFDHAASTARFVLL
ncbi:MAG: hypothetical protein EA428_05800 [Spirochaetaceae bacterium]|nr:MAG: hypothetical protein EA428_05800 [Spirochaetaceae bacterium]